MHSALPPFLLIFDLDGVLYRGSEVVPGAPEALAALRPAGFHVAFLTNNSWSLASDFAAKLNGLGIPASDEEVYTSSMAAAAVTLERHGPSRVLAVGGPGLRHYLTEAGHTVTMTADPPAPVDVVVAGIDWNFTYETLSRAQEALLDGATFYATNLDPRYPFEAGRFKPGAGSLIAAISTASGVEPVVIGKPSSLSIELLMEQYGVKPKQTLVIGDQLATDILAGNRAGCRTALVTTGVNSATEAEKTHGVARPTYVFDSPLALRDALITEELLVVRS
ncbi:MAG: HAD-IIA family hydrolase [bacterium]